MERKREAIRRLNEAVTAGQRQTRASHVLFLLLPHIVFDVGGDGDAVKAEEVTQTLKRRIENIQTGRIGDEWKRWRASCIAKNQDAGEHELTRRVYSMEPLQMSMADAGMEVAPSPPGAAAASSDASGAGPEAGGGAEAAPSAQSATAQLGDAAFMSEVLGSLPGVDTADPRIQSMLGGGGGGDAADGDTDAAWAAGEEAADLMRTLMQQPYPNSGAEEADMAQSRGPDNATRHRVRAQMSQSEKRRMRRLCGQHRVSKVFSHTVGNGLGSHREPKHLAQFIKKMIPRHQEYEGEGDGFHRFMSLRYERDIEADPLPRQKPASLASRFLKLADDLSPGPTGWSVPMLKAVVRKTSDPLAATAAPMLDAFIDTYLHGECERWFVKCMSVLKSVLLVKKDYTVYSDAEIRPLGIGNRERIVGMAAQIAAKRPAYTRAIKEHNAAYATKSGGPKLAMLLQLGVQLSAKRSQSHGDPDVVWISDLTNAFGTIHQQLVLDAHYENEELQCLVRPLYFQMVEKAYLLTQRSASGGLEFVTGRMATIASASADEFAADVKVRAESGVVQGSAEGMLAFCLTMVKMLAELNNILLNERGTWGTVKAFADDVFGIHQLSLLKTICATLIDTARKMGMDIGLDKSGVTCLTRELTEEERTIPLADGTSVVLGHIRVKGMDEEGNETVLCNRGVVFHGFPIPFHADDAEFTTQVARRHIRKIERQMRVTRERLGTDSNHTLMRLALDSIQHKPAHMLTFADKDAVLPLAEEFDAEFMDHLADPSILDTPELRSDWSQEKYDHQGEREYYVHPAVAGLVKRRMQLSKSQGGAAVVSLELHKDINEVAAFLQCLPSLLHDAVGGDGQELDGFGKHLLKGYIDPKAFNVRKNVDGTTTAAFRMDTFDHLHPDLLATPTFTRAKAAWGRLREYLHWPETGPFQYEWGNGVGVDLVGNHIRRQLVVHVRAEEEKRFQQDLMKQRDEAFMEGGLQLVSMCRQT